MNGIKDYRTHILDLESGLNFVFDKILLKKCYNYSYNFRLKNNLHSKQLFRLKNYYLLDREVTSLENVKELEKKNNREVTSLENVKELALVKKDIVKRHTITNFLSILVKDAKIFDRLTSALSSSDLLSTLNSDTFTLFAPTDEAFSRMASPLTSDKLLHVLKRHVVMGRLDAKDLTDGQKVKTLAGTTLTVNISNDNVTINNVHVSLPNIITSNGIIHVVDLVIGVTSKEAPIKTPISKASSVADLVIGSDKHTLLLAALKKADLVETLLGTGPFTVFAPTDDAFIMLVSQLGIELTDLLELPRLKDILLNHVIGEKVSSSMLSKKNIVNSLYGSDLSVSKMGTSFKIDGAMIIELDLEASNGIVHVIDAVLVLSENTSITPAPSPPAPASPTPATPTPATPTPASPASTSIPTSVADVVIGSEKHTILESALMQADLLDTLAGTGPFTLFAPTDDAFTAHATELGVEISDILNKQNLSDLLLNHVLGESRLSVTLINGSKEGNDTPLTNLYGGTITVYTLGHWLRVESAAMTELDIETLNGIVHVIDGVLPLGEKNAPTPSPTEAPITVADIIVNSENHTLLEETLKKALLLDVLSTPGPFTVFAPTDEAFNALVSELGLESTNDLLDNPDLQKILLNHVISGTLSADTLSHSVEVTSLQGNKLPLSNVEAASSYPGHFDVYPGHFDAASLQIGSATITGTDLVASNGVVHVIDAVLVPGESETSVPYTPSPKAESVAKIVSDSNMHTTLLAALTKTELVETLSGTGPFTVFAPTDEAFIALAGELGVEHSELLDLSELPDILLNHVVSGEFQSHALDSVVDLDTLYGHKLPVLNVDTSFKIGKSMVIVSDIEAENGVVHVIDAVLLPSETATSAPQATSIASIIAESPNHSTFQAALQKADLLNTLAGTGPFTVFAPTDGAFAALASELSVEISAILELSELSNILLHHVVLGTVSSSILELDNTISTMEGTTLSISQVGASLLVENGTIITSDLQANNGIVHVVDTVLLLDANAESTPPPIFFPDMNIGDHIQAPSNPSDGAYTPATPTSASTSTSVASLVIGSENHTILESALVKADLVTTLSGPGPFTLFAPTDDAFTALATELGTDTNGILDLPHLSDLLLNHVVGESRLSDTLINVSKDGNETSITSLHGSTLVASTLGPMLRIESALIVEPDLEVDNGVVHVIDTVLVPSVDTSTTPTPTPEAALVGTS